MKVTISEYDAYRTAVTMQEGEKMFDIPEPFASKIAMFFRSGSNLQSRLAEAEKLIGEVAVALTKALSDMENPPHEVSPWSERRLVEALAKIKAFKEGK